MSRNRPNRVVGVTSGIRNSTATQIMSLLPTTTTVKRRQKERRQYCKTISATINGPARFAVIDGTLLKGQQCR